MQLCKRKENTSNRQTETDILEFPDGEDAAAANLVRLYADESAIEEGIAGGRSGENVGINVG